MNRTTLLHVRVTEKPRSYIVEAWDDTAKDFARVDAHDLTVALQMAVPYLRACVLPDPLAALIPSGDTV